MNKNFVVSIAPKLKNIWTKIVAVYADLVWVNLVAMVCLGVGIGALSALDLNPTQLATLEFILLGIHTWFVSCEEHPTKTDCESLKDVTVVENPEH